MTDEDVPTESELVEQLRNGERDPVEDADEVRRPNKYTVQYIHTFDGGEAGLNFRYADGFTDHGKALEPHSANVLNPDFGDGAATYTH
jgi:hypothetical protein